MKFPNIAFGQGFKGKIKLEAAAQDTQPGYEWDSKNLSKSKPPAVVKKKHADKSFATKKKHTGKSTHGRVQKRWKTPTYRP